MAYNKFAQENRNIFIQNFDSIINEFRNGKSIKHLAKEWNVSKQWISEIFIDKGIMKKGFVKYLENENYFEQIDTPNKAYILGLLYADGCNHVQDSNGRTRNHILLSLQIDDYDLLESVRKEIGYLLPLKERKLKSHYIFDKYVDAKNCKKQMVLDFSNKKMSQDLLKWGMVQNKSLKLEFPNISNNLISHFIRGYFDGDGSIYSFYDKKNNIHRIGFKITSTYSFCNTIMDILQKELHIQVSINICNPSHNKITCDLRSQSKQNIYILMQWLYKDANLYMKRKHDKFLELYNMNNSLSA